MESVSFYRKQVEDQKAWIAKCEAGVSYKDEKNGRGEAIRQADLSELARLERYYNIAKANVLLALNNEDLTKDINHLLTAQDRFKAAEQEFENLQTDFENKHPKFWERAAKELGHNRVDYCTEKTFTTDGIKCHLDAFYCGDTEEWDIFIPWYYFVSEQAFKDQIVEYKKQQALDKAAQKVKEAQKRIDELEAEEQKAAKAREVRHQSRLAELQFAQQELEKLKG